MANSLKNPGLGNSGSFGILLLVMVTRIGLIVFCAWNATLYYKILMSFFAPEGGLFRLLIGFVALILWALLQVLEVLPLLVKGSLGALALLIKAAERFRGLEVSKSDNPLVASLKAQYNAFPQRWIGRVMLFCYGAFCADLAILLRYFEPFSISFTGLAINWAELLWLLICLSTVQVVVFLWLLAEGGRAIFKPEVQPTTGKSGSGRSIWDDYKDYIRPTKSAAPKDEPQQDGGDRPASPAGGTVSAREVLQGIFNGKGASTAPGQAPADEHLNRNGQTSPHAETK